MESLKNKINTTVRDKAQLAIRSLEFQSVSISFAHIALSFRMLSDAIVVGDVWQQLRDDLGDKQ